MANLPGMVARSEPMSAPSCDGAQAPARIPAAGGSWRWLTISVVLLANVVGTSIVVLGAWATGLTLIFASHLWFLWGTLKPGSRLFGPVVRRFDTPRREVWLTMDDGPSADTAAMLDLLDAHCARATFFLVGERAEAQPGAVRAILERGHGIGNHTAGHSAAWFWATLPSQMARQIGSAQASLTRLSGAAPRLFRAVAGMANVFVAPVLREHGLILIGWSARGYDSVSADPDRVSVRLLRGLRPGAILLLHEGAGHGSSVATLARVLAKLDASGYRCVLPEFAPPVASTRSATTSQLLNGVPPHNGEKLGVSPASRSKASSVSRCG